jgi:hypothetical protein
MMSLALQGLGAKTPRHANFYVGERVAKDARLGIDTHSAALERPKSS